MSEFGFLFYRCLWRCVQREPEFIAFAASPQAAIAGTGAATAATVTATAATVAMGADWMAALGGFTMRLRAVAAGLIAIGAVRWMLVARFIEGAGLRPASV